jgi:stage V sporulation protein SpoVS
MSGRRSGPAPRKAKSSPKRLAGEVASVGKKQATNGLVFGVTSGAQKIKAITVKSGAKDPELEGWGAGLTLEATDALTFEEAVEVT